MIIVNVLGDDVVVRMPIDELREIMRDGVARPPSPGGAPPVHRLCALRVADECVETQRRRDRVADRVGDDFNRHARLQRRRRK